MDTQAQDCMYVQRAGSMVHQAVSHHVDTYMALLQANWRGHSPLPVAQRGPELTGPLPELSEQASMQRRAFKFLGMIATGGENAALPEALADALAAPRVISDETAREEMRLGAGRSLRRSGSENPRLLDEMLCAATTTFHRYMLGSPDPLLLPYQGLPQWALLMCDAEHLNGLDAALAPLPSSMLPMILVADSVTHNRGAADALARFPQWQVQSLAKFLLAGYGFSLVAAPDHDCEATEIVLAAASSRGSQVAKWAADPARPDVIALRQIGSLAVDRQPTGLRHAFVDFPVLSPMPSSLTDFSSG